MQSDHVADTSSPRIEILPWNESWPARFDVLRRDLQAALGDAALRIDHIGSTAIPGMAGKPVLDVQVSVPDLQAFDRFGPPLTRLGFQFREHNPERTKRYFREAPGAPRTHVHVRQAGSWHEQWALLFRDYMRATPKEYPAYEALKRDLAARFVDDMQAYAEAKADHFWQVIRRADQWAKDVGWSAKEFSVA